MPRSVILKLPASIRRIVERWVPWLLLSAMLAGMIGWIRRPGDFAAYLEVGGLALKGGHIYRDVAPSDYWNAWPPSFSLLCVPLALLARIDVYVARGAWLALNLALTWVVLSMAVRLVHGTRLTFQPARRDLPLGSLLVLLPLILCSRFFLGNFDHVQVNIVIYALALGGLLWAARGRIVAGGLLLGLAAGLKVMPVAFLPYLAYRGRWRFAAVATATAVAVFFLAPVLAYGPDRAMDYFATWWAGTHADFGSAKMNQSVYAMFDRFLGHGITPFNVFPTSVLPFSWNPVVGRATGFLFGIVALACLWAFRGRAHPSSPAALAEYGAVFLVGSLFGPLTWKAYLIILLLPCVLLVALLNNGVLKGFDRLLSVAALAVCAFASLDTPGLVGARLSGKLAMLSDCTIAGLLMLSVLIWLRARGRLPTGGKTPTEQ
jgi:alpha-1,2-mannosyltransferase